MKKLILLVFVACAAIISQADPANWGLSGALIYDGTGKTDDANKIAVGTPTFVFDGGFIEQIDVYNAWVKGDDLSKLDGFIFKGANNALGGFAPTAATCKFQYSEIGSTKEIPFFLAITADDKIYFTKINPQAPNGISTSKSLIFASQNDPSKGTYSSVAPTGAGFNGPGYWSAVPEPTSALLMLLGMAGLAIRRRRA